MANGFTTIVKGKRHESGANLSIFSFITFITPESNISNNSYYSQI